MTSRSKSAPWADPDAAEGDLLQPERGEGQPEERLRRTSKCNDWWIIPVWVAATVVFMGVGFSAYVKYKDEMTAPPSSAVQKRTAPALTKNAYALVGFMCMLALAISTAFLMLVKRHAKEVMKVSLVSFLVYVFALVVYYGMTNRTIACVIMAICWVIYAIWVYYIWDRVDFSAKVLATVSHVLHEWPSTIAVALGGLVAQAAWFVMWLVLAVSIFFSMKIEFENGRPVSADDKSPTKRVVTFQLAGVLFLLLLAFFWTSQVLRNLVHVTVSGVLATWYFLFPAQMPAGHPTRNALRRACTTSFGSIVLASLVNAVVNALRATVQLMRGWAQQEEASCITVAVLCIVECLLRMIEAVVEYINSYALSYVAIYGKPYFDSARLALDLLTRRGLDAVINDDLVGIACFMTCVFSGGVCALLAGLMCGPLAAGGDWKVWAALGFLLGLCLTYTVMAVVESSVITLFVCLADDPVVLKNTKKEVYDQLVPDMQQRYEDVDLQPVNNNDRRNRSDNV